MNAEKFTEIINALEEKPVGTLRFYGEWFGRPYDNHHKITGCCFKEDILKIKFDAGETVNISKPDNIIFNDKELLIQDSIGVELSRYPYGKPHTDEFLIRDRYSEKDVDTNEDNNYPAFELF